MAKFLVFLESYTKQKTIKNFLGDDYEIFATGGHLMELEKKGYLNLGVDLKKFTPCYEIIPKKKKDTVFWQNYYQRNKPSLILLATDPDREGEGIAREVIEILKIPQNSYKRLLFHEITAKSVQQALKNPLSLDNNLVEAQMSRQVLDRMIGFCLSTLLQKKTKALSAGRVQSVVLKMVVERELAIINYGNKKEFILQGIYKVGEENYYLKQKTLEGNLVIYSSKEEAEKVKKSLGAFFVLQKKEEEEKYIFSNPPLTTSKLLYEAKSQLGFSVAKTTKLAQQLYEGIWIKSKNKQLSLITYPRTDSSRLNTEFINEAYQFIQNKWGKNYCQFSPQHQIKKNSLQIQDAHEAIRPSYFSFFPQELKDSLTEEQYQLYNLIHLHTLASLMSPCRIEKNLYLFTNNGYHFTMKESWALFPGFFIIAPDYYFSRYKIKKEALLKKKNLDNLQIKEIEVKEYLGNKPQRYNEGILVQELERLGIGRPSTYNTFSKILVERNYVNYNEKNHFVPTELGFTANEWLQNNFAFLINENYTANLETELDKISRGENSYLIFIQNFWNNFFPHYQKIGTEPNQK